MAGIRPFFVTGDKLKIKLNGKTIAFATNLTCSIQINHQTPHVLGMYEGVSVEPLAYNVTGSFSIIRYVRNAQANIDGTPPQGISDSDAGNGVGNWGSMWGGGLFNNILGNPSGGLSGSGSDGRANEALDPSTYAQGTSFDIEVYQKIESAAGITTTTVSTLIEGGNNSTTTTRAGTGTTDVIGIIKIRSVRITKADFSIDKKSPGMDKFEFVALYVDGDAYVANPSGTGQQNT